MPRTMLIDASHPEETRVAVVDGTRLEDLDFESAAKRQIRGNVYLARVTRVEPSLQAAFVEYGGNRHGFLAFSEIHPDYYQIPHEDRAVLLAAEQAESLQDEEDEEENLEKKSAKPASGKKTSTKKGGRKKPAPLDDDNDEDEDDTEEEENNNSEDDTDDTDDNDDNDDGDREEEIVDAVDAEVEAEQEKMHGARRKRMAKRRYKIQEVVKRGQILLVQAVKEERGNKGAALTTYLSLAGRYCVLMPNTPRGGGISRKIANGSDRKRLKSVMSELSVPQGMGLIVRTAGAKRTKTEIKRDYLYLSKLWDTIRKTTLKSVAPTLIHEEANLVKRSIRDLYGKDIEKVFVQGDDAYRLAKDFMKLLMPSHAKNVQPYKDDIPLFLRFQVESQIEACLDPIAQLRSGGYLVIHPTEALVSVDVNSGRSTKERNVERTALKTNLEAAEEVARQMRLRDLAGLVVIDFIDMDQHRNNRAVEKRMRDALADDRARVQMNKISQFGLMELSRQRRRRSLLEGSSASCEHCDGVGRKRSVDSSALKALRAIEEEGIRGHSKRIRIKVTPKVAQYLFNEKRDLLNEIEAGNGMFAEIIADPDLIRPAFEIERLGKKADTGADPLEEIAKEHRKSNKSRRSRGGNKPQNTQKSTQKGAQRGTQQDGEKKHAGQSDTDDNNKPTKSKRRRGRRGGRRRRGNQNRDANATNEAVDTNLDQAAPDSQDKPSQDKAGKDKAGKDTTGENTGAKAAKTAASDAKTAKKPARAKTARKKSEAKKSEAKKSDGQETAEKKPARKRKSAAKKPEKTVAEKPVTNKDETEKPSKRKKPAAQEKPVASKTAKAEKTKSAKIEKPAKPKAKSARTATPANKTKAEPKPAKVDKKPDEKKSDNKKPKKTGWWQKRKPFG